MTGLLTIAAVVTMIALIISATNTASNATPQDTYKRGPWGIARWDRTRNRPLNPHERRWQTSLLSAKDNPSRWRDLVAEIQALEHTMDATPVDAAPKSFDAAWVEASIANLESAVPLTPGDLTS